LLVNPTWIDVDALRGFDLLAIPESEPWGANVALVGSSVCMAADHVQTAEIIRERGFDVQAVDISEFAKAEGGVTCLSILFSDFRLEL
jgi:dimethylargininase